MRSPPSSIAVPPQLRAINLDRLHWNCQQVVHQPDFLLDERFGVAHSRKKPIEAGHRRDARADLRVARPVPEAVQ